MQLQHQTIIQFFNIWVYHSSKDTYCVFLVYRSILQSDRWVQTCWEDILPHLMKAIMEHCYWYLHTSQQQSNIATGIYTLHSNSQTLLLVSTHFTATVKHCYWYLHTSQ